jgi:GNAT superfamily N-acetyltransferase
MLSNHAYGTIVEGEKMIKIIENQEEKSNIARYILEALPEWFGIEAAREEYIEESRHQYFIAAVENDIPIGFLCLKGTGKDTYEIAVMGVKKEYQHVGIGKQLFVAAKQYAKQQGISFLQVKTVAMGHYEEYDQTNKFYLSLGFKEFEVFPTLWDKHNPCQVYVMAIS